MSLIVSSMAIAFVDFFGFLTACQYRNLQIRMALWLRLASDLLPASDCTKSSPGWTQLLRTSSPCLVIF